ncbi:MAG: gliding motility lipoprotein GldH [Bacteroidota bacterium]
MRVPAIIMALCAIVLVSCNSNKVFQKYEKIGDNKWMRENTVNFDVTIDDTKPDYNVEVAIRHSSYYAFADLLFNVTIVSPSGEIRTKDFDEYLREKDGTFKGEGAGDLWDITFPAFTKSRFNEPGVYKISVQNIMPYTTTEDIMEVGLIVTKAKE